MTKKEIGRILRQARDLMNDEGTHWAKGVLHRRVKGVGHQYCSIGAVCSTLGVELRDTRISAAARPALYALATEIRRSQGWGKQSGEFHDDHHLLNTITRYNDAGSTTWKQLKGVFSRAAHKPETFKATKKKKAVA